jgi:hypothetical protein
MSGLEVLLSDREAATTPTRLSKKESLSPGLKKLGMNQVDSAIISSNEETRR